MNPKPKPTKATRPKKSKPKEYPLDDTLKKYGLNRADFKMILEAQGHICPICGKVPTSGKWHIDHEHVRNWKSMKSEKRKQYVRGILCFFCNRFYMAKQMTKTKSKNIVTYLESYENRQRSTI